MDKNATTHNDVCPPRRAQRARAARAASTTLGGHGRGAHRAARRWGATLILAALGTTVPLLSHSADMEPFADAEQKLRAAWAQKKSHDVAGNLGAALLKLGDPVQAARFLAYAVEHHPVGGKPSVKKLTEELLAEAKAKAVEVRLRITGDAPAPAIRVDGTPVEAALVGDRIFIAPGERVLEASAKGYPTAQKTVNAKEGQSVEVELKLVPVAPAGRSWTVPAIAFGTGGAGLIVGVVAVAITALKTGELRAKCGDALVCPRSAEDDGNAALTSAHAGTAGFIVAGVGAAVGATFLLLPSKPQTTAGRLGMIVSPTFTGVRGEF